METTTTISKPVTQTSTPKSMTPPVVSKTPAELSATPVVKPAVAQAQERIYSLCATYARADATFWGNVRSEMDILSAHDIKPQARRDMLKAALVKSGIASTPESASAIISAHKEQLGLAVRKAGAGRKAHKLTVEERAAVKAVGEAFKTDAVSTALKAAGISGGLKAICGKIARLAK